MKPTDNTLLGQHAAERSNANAKHAAYSHTDTFSFSKIFIAEAGRLQRRTPKILYILVRPAQNLKLKFFRIAVLIIDHECMHTVFQWR